MNGRSAKVARKAARETADAVAPVLNAAADHALSLQRRVEALEARCESLGRELNAHGQVVYQSFLGRLRWFLGR